MLGHTQYLSMLEVAVLVCLAQIASFGCDHATLE